MNFGRKRNYSECEGCEIRFYDPNTFKTHMVEKHGYKQVGQQVFRSTPCRHCPKPGLYKVGVTAFCADHKHLAVRGTLIDRNQKDAKLGPHYQDTEIFGHELQAREAFRRHSRPRK